MAEEDNFNAYSSSGSSGNDFCLLSDDDIAGAGDVATESQDASEKHLPHQSAATAAEPSRVFGISAPVDVEAIKQKAEELAKSLQKALSTVSKNAGISGSLENIEIRDDLKQHRERSLYVEQKLKEDRKLFEESKKRSEAVFDKVQSVKRIQESISENVRELNRKDTDDTHSLRLKIQSLEDTVSRLQESLSNKNRIISEKNEQIRSLNQSVSDTHDAYMHSLEQSESEIDRVKNEYKKKIEDVFSSKEELYNQLQLVRKNYLTVENDLKLSDFARSRLVNRNAELQEKILTLEKDNEKASAKLFDESGSVQSSKTPQADLIDDIRPKIENLVIITNEFSTFLSDDPDDIEELSVDDDDLSQSVDSIGDKLEAAFFTMRDKLSSVPKVQSKLEKANKEVRRMETLLRENEQQIANLQQQLSATRTKLDEEIRENARLVESIRNEPWQGMPPNPPTPSQPRNSDSDSCEQNSQLDQLKRECLHLNVELESKSNEIQMLTSNIDELNETIRKLQQERQQLRRQVDEKSDECENVRRSREEICDQLESVRQESAEQRQRMSHEYQLLQETCRELQSKCDYLDEELQVTVEQVEKLRAQQDEQLEKEENDFVVLQTKDCDDEDSVKRQCQHLKDENEKLIATMRTMSEKAIEYENERLTLQKYVNECSRLQELVKRLGQELEVTKKHLYQASVASRETEDDKNDEIESMQDEMAKLEQQLSRVWDQLHEEKTHNHQLSEQLGSCEKANASISQQMQQQNAELEFLRKSNAELMQKLRLLSESSKPDEVAALQEHSFQLQKTLDQIQHDYQVTKNELQAAQTSLEQFQNVVDELERLKRENYDLQGEISKLSQKYETLELSYNENSELLARKDAELSKATAEAQKSFKELHETVIALHEAQSDLQFTRNEKEVASRCLEESKVQADQTREQLEAAQEELQTVTARLYESENSVHDLMQKYKQDIETFQDNLATLKSENAAVKQQCELYRSSYINLQSQVSHIISAASRTSDDALSIVYRLQSQWPSSKAVVHAETQCGDELEADIRSEAETYKLLLEDMKEELSTLKNCYEKVQQELLQRNEEIEKFVSHETQMNDLLSEVKSRLDSTECALSQKNEDFRRQTQEFQHRLQSSEADYVDKLQHYQNQIDQLEQKLLETRKPEVLDSSVQVSSLEKVEESQIASFKQEPSFADVDLRTAKDFFDTHGHPIERDGSGFDDIQPGTDKEGPGLMKYFGYYKEKMAKGLTEMLNPEEQAPDYSNWILPDQPIVERQLIPEEARTPLVTEAVQSSSLPLTQVSVASSAPLPQMSVSDILDKLQNAIASQTNDGGWDVDEDSELSCNQLQLRDADFVNTAFKFVDLFDIVVQYYSSLPATDAVLEKLGNIAAMAKPPSTVSDLQVASEVPETLVAEVVDTSREAIEQMVTLATLLENENKYLVDAIAFLEETIAGVRPSEDIRFQSVIEYWHSRVTVDDDVIDRVCEEYDIVPAKFVPGDQLVQWKEQMARCMEAILMPPSVPSAVLPAPAGQEMCPIPVAENLQLLKKKVRKLICDLHYIYKDEGSFNPVDFFAQIEDINHAVEATAKMASNKEEKVGGPTEIPSHGSREQHHAYGHEDSPDHGHHDHDHSEHDHDHSHHGHDHSHHGHDHSHHGHDHSHHDHDHSDHDHDHNPHSHDQGVLSHEHGHHAHDHTSHHHHHSEHPESAEELDQRDTVADLKALLGESNKKIDSLVKELMEVKSSREYNEVRQLHTKLDETLYQLHLRDVHVVELTRELTQLLAERDSLQLKLSNIIRQNEHLREIAVSNAASGTVMQLSDLENKLEELQGVNYMKDPRISEASKKYHVTGMQLYHEEQRNKEEASSSIVPSFLKWFTGDTETK